MRYLSPLTLILLCVGSLNLAAQELRDSKGRDFWVAFPPTEHDRDGENSLLAIFISADVDAAVRIDARDRTGQTRTTNANVLGGTIAQFDFDYELYELRSAEYPNGPVNDCERPMPSSIHVTSDEEVTVYAVDRDLNTSDAWLVLPTDALGHDHRVLSYSSDAMADTVTFPFPFPRFTKGYPSQFVVMATEDNTSVSIDLSPGRSNTGNTAARTVTLDRGESYLVQARVTVSSQNDDLTGTRVRANRPIVVLGSHFRCQAPIIDDGASRDILMEQIPSVDTWGKYFVVPPLTEPDDAYQWAQNDVNIIRILAHTDSTEVTIAGLPVITLRAGRTWDVPLSSGRVIQSTSPILVGIISRSTKREQFAVTRTGDPSMILVPPIEQYLSQYRMISIEPLSSGTAFYKEHLLTITAPLVSGASIRVDGMTVAPLTQIDTSDHGYVTVRVGAGQHEVWADTTLGIIAYGYGPAESYGYTGGMAFEKLYQPTVVLRVLDAAAAPGEPVALTVVVDTILERGSFIAYGITHLDGVLDVDRTVFVPQEHDVATVEMRSRIAFSADFDTLSIGDTVGTITGTAVLGMVESDSVQLLDPQWADSFGQPFLLDTRVINGELVVNELCRSGGLVRLFDPFTSVPPMVRYYDLTGRERERLLPGWNLVVTTTGSVVHTDRVWIAP